MVQSTATLRTIPLPDWSATVRRLELDCPHATTGISIFATATTPHVDDADAIRMILARHHAEEGCRCTRRLWRQYFGAALGELVLVKGHPE
jgi:hypothetical protein